MQARPVNRVAGVGSVLRSLRSERRPAPVPDARLGGTTTRSASPSPTGGRLLAWELGHVVVQPALKIGSTSDPLEHDAEQFARQVLWQRDGQRISLRRVPGEGRRSLWSSAEPPDGVTHRTSTQCAGSTWARAGHSVRSNGRSSNHGWGQTSGGSGYIRTTMPAGPRSGWVPEPSLSARTSPSLPVSTVRRSARGNAFSRTRLPTSSSSARQVRA